MDLCPQLRRLADEHARWLEQGRRREGESTAEQAVRLLAGWEDEIVPHCRAEEEVLLPELARHLSETDAVVVFTHGDHLVLRRLARELRLAREPARPAALGSFLEKLEEHFRFEEQTLFPALQQAIGCDCLAELGAEIASTRGIRRPVARRAPVHEAHGKGKTT
jgi:hemerythrin-like domain-containing protein